MTFRMRGAAPWAVLGLTLSVGCSLYVGDIDRTQPDKVSKAYFQDGKPWYFRQTIVDIPATSSITFIGEQGRTEKVVWAIDENYLFAYRAYEWLKGGEEFSARPGVPYRGTPIAAFAIQGHFDIKRDYNPQTGEQTNVISENASDRPWYEREYMRVDWSNNLITDFQFSGSYVSQQPVTRYVHEYENSRDAAKITADYVDVVHEIVAEPELHAWLSAYWGMPVPMCWLYSNVFNDCMGSRIKVRSSFMKAKEDNVYEPLTFDDHKFDKFGYFRVDRYGYDHSYGVVDTAVDYLIERFNIWKRAPGEPSCRDDSLDHPWANCGNDKIKPIVYHVNEDFPDSLIEAERRIGAEWNRVFKIGDLRYNFVYWVVSDQAASPLGYGPHAPDPLTGEVISANAFVYGAAMEWYAQYTLDFVKLMNGDLAVSDFYNAAQIAQHYQRVAARRQQTELRMEPEDLREVAKNLNIQQKAQVLRERISRGEMQSDEIPARLNRVRGTPLEAVFFPETMRRALAPQYENASDVPAGMDKYLNAATLHDPVYMRWHKERENKLSRASMCMAEFWDDGVAGWATKLNCKSNMPPDFDKSRVCNGDQLDEQKAYQFILEDQFIATTLHEIGHTVGLRHNFAATNDVINYFPKYWELRGLTLRDANQTTLKPEFNLTNRVEQEGLKTAINLGLREYQYSSIMDYGAKPNSDVWGLGLFDAAAIKYGYGEMVEVFDKDADTPPGVTRSPDLTTNEKLLPGIRHYTVVPDIVANNDQYTYDQRWQSMYKRKTVKESQVMADPTLVEVPYRFCSDEYVGGQATCYRFDEGADAYEQARDNAIRYENYYVFNGLRRGRVGFGMNLEGYISRIYGRYFSFLTEVNKHFLNDSLITRFYDAECEQGIHFVDPKCGLDRFAGALEAANALGRVLQMPEPGCYIRRKAGCYLDSYEEVNKLPATIERKPDTFCANPPGEPGGSVTLVTDAEPYMHIEDSVNCDPMLEIPLGEGRFSLDKYDRSTFGYYFYWKPTTIGSWWDKWLAMQALGDPWTDFIGVDAQGNARSYLISFNSLFRNQVQDAVGSYITEDYEHYAPWVVKQPDGTPAVQYRELVPTVSAALGGRLPIAMPAGAIPLNPEADGQYMTRLQALYIGSSYYTYYTDDQDFNQSLFIGKAGSTVDVTVPDSIRSNPNRYVEITDPATGQIYFAVKMTPGSAWFLAEQEFYSIGYEYVKKVRDKFFTPDGRQLRNPDEVESARSEIRMFEIIRGMLNIHGYSNSGGFAWDE